MLGQVSQLGPTLCNFRYTYVLPVHLTLHRVTPGDGAPWDPATGRGSGCPGACSVSTKCYLPNILVEQWVLPRLQRSKNLRLFLRTVITDTTRDSATGAITSLTAVQRTPREGTTEWSQRLSVELPDWYAATESASFAKKRLLLKARVFIEATELADVLATANVPYGQGIEIPYENSSTYENCGQAQTLTFYMELLAHPKADAAPQGNDEGRAFPGSRGTAWATNLHGWYNSWTWRRSFAAANRSVYAASVGDITQQNSGNDLDTAYVFLSIPDSKREASTGWRGGLNLSAVRMLEDVSYGWFRNMQHASAVLNESWPTRLVLNRDAPGTAHGLSKFPYFRDTRRAIGIGGFRLTHAPLRDVQGVTGTEFYDSVGACKLGRNPPTLTDF